MINIKIITCEAVGKLSKVRQLECSVTEEQLEGLLDWATRGDRPVYEHTEGHLEVVRGKEKEDG